MWLIMKVIFWYFWDKKSEHYHSELYYRAVILNWRFLRLNSWPDCVAISRDIARHGSNSYIWFTGKVLDLSILKLMFSLLDCMCYLPIIISTKSPISNDSPVVEWTLLFWLYRFRKMIIGHRSASSIHVIVLYVWFSFAFSILNPSDFLE